jgi:hypothetical protein
LGKNEMRSFIYIFFFLLSVFICVHLWFQMFFCAEAREDCQGCLFCALAALSYWADARRAAVFAGAGGDQFARLCEQQAVRPEERFRETDSARVCVIEIQVGLEEFLFGKGSYRF